MGYIEELRAIVEHRPLILVGSVVIITDSAGRMLLQQRRYPYGVWGLPGGLMELGESVEDTTRREVHEETGLRIGKLALIGVFSGSQYYVKAGNGDEFYIVTSAFHTSDFDGSLQVDYLESLNFSFFDTSNLPSPILSNHKTIIDAYLAK